MSGLQSETDYMESHGRTAERPFLIATHASRRDVHVWRSNAPDTGYLLAPLRLAVLLSQGIGLVCLLTEVTVSVVKVIDPICDRDVPFSDLHLAKVAHAVLRCADGFF